MLKREEGLFIAFFHQELVFGYMVVTHTARENRVAYIKREFTVYNKKVDKDRDRQRQIQK